MFLKKKVVVPFAALCMLLGYGSAQADLSFNVSAVSLYKSRGVDQESKDKNLRPNVQFSLDYAFDNGLYVGNWNSTGKFNDADMEIDLYAGYVGQVTADFNYDIGYVHYLYPDFGNWNSGEIYLGLNYKDLRFKAYRGVTSRVNKKDMYYKLDYSYPLTETVSLNVGGGYLNYGAKGVKEKFDYRAGFGYKYNNNISMSLTYAGASHKHLSTSGARDNRLIFSVGYGF